MNIAELFEIFMIVAFGFSWPMNVAKSLKAKTTKGKSLLFLILIFTGYLFGIAGKIIGYLSYNLDLKWYVLFFYILNTVMVGFDLLLYARNYRLDKKNGIL